MVGRMAIAVSALFATAAGLLAAVAARPADAAATAWAKHEFARARLVSAVSAVGDLQQVRLGLHLKLESGWWTYWRSPGDAGLPAQVDWSGSENLAEATLLWPAPQRHTLLGIETFGYEGEVLLPVVARVDKPGAPLRLALRDADLAREDLRRALAGAAPAAAALLLGCSGRGRGLFRHAGLEAALVARALGATPLAGAFGAFPLGPAAGASALHAYAAVLALLDG